MLSTILIATGIILLLAVILSVSDNLLQIEAKKSGIDIDQEDVGIIPKLSFDGNKSKPNFAKNSASYHKLKKGFDIKLAGEASKVNLNASSSTFAVRPMDFRGIAPIPKLFVEVGQEVKAGQPLFYNKTTPDVIYAAPVSGEVIEVRRGAKRAISDVIILADKKQVPHTVSAPDLTKVSREDLVTFLVGSGAWPMINKRPFDVIADPADEPRDIFISGFDTAPLAPDASVLLEGKEKDFQAGLNVLAKLTSGGVHLSLNQDQSESWIAGVNNVHTHYFSGKHPAGNVGVQIHHISPIHTGDTVWTLGVQEVASIGSLFTKGHLDCSRKVAIVGSEFTDTGYVNTHIGAQVSEIVGDNLASDNVRLVAGDVLSGRKVAAEDFLSFTTDQITTIKEGDYNEFLGWLVPIAPRPTLSGTFPNFLYPNFKFSPDTNTHGEKRAFVASGQYESVLPMDIYPTHLMKAILANDYERMEGLGINELSEEDIALCEFACVSKQPLQKILRQGLDMMREQL